MKPINQQLENIWQQPAANRLTATTTISILLTTLHFVLETTVREARYKVGFLYQKMYCFWDC